MASPYLDPEFREQEKAGSPRGLSARWYLGGVLLALAAGLGLYLWLGPKSPVPKPVFSRATAGAKPQLGLAAAFDGSLWKVTWSADDVNALQPSRALLLIRDGQGGRAIALSGADLASGKFFYAPQSGDLLFSLSVERPGGPPLEEHLRIGNMALKSTPVPGGPQSASESKPRPPGTREGAKAEPAPLAKAPAAAEDHGSSNPSAILSPTPNTEPTLVAPAAAASGSVQLRVTLDEEGHPTSVTLVSRTDANSELIEAAIRAASSWVFEPTRENGRPVPSVQVLNFRLGY